MSVQAVLFMNPTPYIAHIISVRHWGVDHVSSPQQLEQPEHGLHSDKMGPKEPGHSYQICGEDAGTISYTGNNDADTTPATPNKKENGLLLKNKLRSKMPL